MVEGQQRKMWESLKCKWGGFVNPNIGRSYKLRTDLNVLQSENQCVYGLLDQLGVLRSQDRWMHPSAGEKEKYLLICRYKELVHRNKYIPFVIHSSPKACEMMFWSSHIVNVNTLKWEKNSFQNSPQNNNWSKFWTLALQAALKWVYIIACNMSDFKTLLQWWWLY